MTRDEMQAAVADVLGIHAQPWRLDTIMRLHDAACQDYATEQVARAVVPAPKDGPAVHFLDVHGTSQIACKARGRDLRSVSDPGLVTCQGCMHTGAWRAAAETRERTMSP
jgi:hypothetical protein